MTVRLRGTCKQKHKHSGDCSTWYYDFRLRGQRHRGAIPEARTKKNAEDAEAVIRSDLFSGRFGEATKQTPNLKVFIEKVYLPWSKANNKSWYDDETRSRAIIEFFKKERIAEISSFDIERFKKKRRETKTIHSKDRSGATVNRELGLLSRIFSHAIQAGHIKENPCFRVKKLKETSGRTRFLSLEEEARLFSELEANELLKNLVLFALNSGMRRGEIFSLKWSEIDFERNLIHVIETKSGRNRVVPINQNVQAVLQRQKQKQWNKPSELVFPSERTGKRLVKVHKSFVKACNAAEVLKFRFHDLRHTFASRLAEAGADAFTIAELLGHSNLEMTKRYTHATDERKREAVNQINQPFSKKVVTIWSQDEKRKFG